MKKKVLFVLDSLGCGGAERSLVSLLNMIDENHYSVDLLLFKQGGIFEKEIPNHINIIPTPAFLSNRSIMSLIKKGNLYGLFLSLKTSISLRLHKNTHPAETMWKGIHSAIPSLDASYDIAIAYSQGFPTYYVSEKVNSPKKFAWINADFDKAGYNFKFNNRFYKKFNKIVSVSDNLTQMLLSNHNELSGKVVTIYDILFPKSIFKLSEDIGFTDDYKGLRLLTIGRIVAPKGYDIAVRAAKIIKDKGYDFRWYVIGDGPNRKAVEEDILNNGVQNCFILLGMKSNPYSYLKDADIYVQTSKFEGFGLTISEAKMFSRAIVSTNFPSVFNQLEDMKNGLITEMTPQDVAEKIMLLIDNKELRESLMAANKSDVYEKASKEYGKFVTLIESK